MGRKFVFLAAVNPSMGRTHAFDGRPEWMPRALFRPRKTISALHVVCITRLEIPTLQYGWCAKWRRGCPRTLRGPVRGQCGQMVQTKRGGTISGRALKKANSWFFGVARSLLRI